MRHLIDSHINGVDATACKLPPPKLSAETRKGAIQQSKKQLFIDFPVGTDVVESLVGQETLRIVRDSKGVSD